MGIPFLVWLPVVGYEGLYEVSDRGDIYSKKSRSKPVMQFDIFGNLIAEYPSASEASRATGIHISNIFHSCKGRTKHPSQFIWKYKEV
jgi:hypothetical protein